MKESQIWEYDAHVQALMLHCEASYWLRYCGYDSWRIDSRLVSVAKKRGKEAAQQLRTAIDLALAQHNERRAGDLWG